MRYQRDSARWPIYCGVMIGAGAGSLRLRAHGWPLRSILLLLGAAFAVAWLLSRLIQWDLKRSGFE
jgi:hypothetical protein